jgi:hypothetical protein
MDHLNVELSRLRQEIEAVMWPLHQHSNLPRDAQDFLEEIMWYFLPTAGPETSVQRPQSGTTTLWETVNRIRHVSLRNLAVVRRYEAEVIYGLVSAGNRVRMGGGDARSLAFTSESNALTSIFPVVIYLPLFSACQRTSFQAIVEFTFFWNDAQLWDGRNRRIDISSPCISERPSVV